MQGKTALITGGSAGIGKAAAFAFGREGAKVIITSRTESTGKAAEEELQAAGIKATWLQVDVSNAAQVKTVLVEAKSVYGQIDFAFNNAKSGGQAGLVADIAEQEWDKTISGVLSSVFYCMKYELEIMVKQGYGVIVNNASVDGLRGFPMDPAYSAAKHGVIGLTKSAALQYAQTGIRINAICPSWVRTDRIDQKIRQTPGMEEEIMIHQPIGRLATPEEIAAATVWLCSDKASFILGTAIPIDGGYTAL